MATSTFQRHMTAIRHTVTRTNIIGMRKALNAFERNRRGYPLGRTAPEWNLDMVRECHADVERYAPVITGDWHATGVALLRKALQRYPGRFDAWQNAIIGDIWHFRLMAWECDENWHYCPVIRVTARNGLWFDFINIPWQSGGDGPEIVHGYCTPSVKPLWDCAINYRTPSGRLVQYSRMLAGNSWFDLRDDLMRSLQWETRRNVAEILPDSFTANFVSMQIGSN